MWGQLLANGIVAGLLYGLIAQALTIAYRLDGFFNFAHAALMTVPAYLTWALAGRAGWPLPLAAAAAVLAAVALNLALEGLVFHSLRQRRAPPAVLLLASLGIAIVAQNIVAMAAGDEIQTLGQLPERASEPPRHVLGVHLALPQRAIVLAHVVLVGALAALLRTRLGLQLRALADAPSLAVVVGVNVARARLAATSAAAVFAAAAGILLAWDRALSPSLGFDVLLLGIVAAIAGGTSWPRGATAGGILVGLAESLAMGWLPGSWSRTTTAAILLVLLFCGPRGALGTRALAEDR